MVFTHLGRQWPAMTTVGVPVARLAQRRRRGDDDGPFVRRAHCETDWRKRFSFLRFNFFFILVFRFVTVTAFSMTPTSTSGRIRILYLEPEEYTRTIHNMCILSSVVYNITYVYYYHRHLLYSVNDDGGRRVRVNGKIKTEFAVPKRHAQDWVINYYYYL